MADRPFVSPRRLKEFFKLLLKEKLDTVEEIEANTDVGKFAGAMALKEVNSSLKAQPNFIYDEDGKITGYQTKAGADTVFPFSSSHIIDLGTAKSFDLTSITDNYGNITVDDFIIEANSCTLSGQSCGNVSGNNTWISAQYTITKEYDASMGILTAYATIKAFRQSASDSSTKKLR